MFLSEAHNSIINGPPAILVSVFFNSYYMTMTSNMQVGSMVLRLVA